MAGWKNLNNISWIRVLGFYNVGTNPCVGFQEKHSFGLKYLVLWPQTQKKSLALPPSLAKTMAARCRLNTHPTQWACLVTFHTVLQSDTQIWTVSGLHIVEVLIHIKTPNLMYLICKNLHDQLFILKIKLMGRVAVSRFSCCLFIHPASLFASWWSLRLKLYFKSSWNSARFPVQTPHFPLYPVFLFWFSSQMLHVHLHVTSVVIHFLWHTWRHSFGRNNKKTMIALRNVSLAGIKGKHTSIFFLPWSKCVNLVSASSIRLRLRLPYWWGHIGQIVSGKKTATSQVQTPESKA